ncbi:MAG: hypothetical protein JNL80_07785 [Phycisphaerae bacterium]|nr:hypothetical protein [Phycisphaerae bacterium]
MKTVLARFLIWTVVTLNASIACAQDNIHQRPPLTWDEVERSIRRFADVDGAPSWSQAWPKMEDAYLQFLVEEDRRRATDGRALAEAYERVIIGVATVEEIGRFHARWEAHLERTDLAEDDFLRSLERLVPESSTDAARSLLRERQLMRAIPRCAGNAPDMLRLIGSLLDAKVVPEARHRMREAVRTTEEAMLPQVRALVAASAARRRAEERGLAEQAWLLRSNPPLEEAVRSRRSIEIREATALALAAPTTAIGQAHAAIERLGVDALLTVVSTLEGEERQRVIAALGAPRLSFGLAATMRYYEKRLASIERRYPPSEAAKAVIEEASRRLRAEADELLLAAYRGLREDAKLAGQHLLDIDGGRPSSWLAACNERQAKERDAFDEALGRWSTSVRAALGVPNESRWPRHDRNAKGEAIVDEPTPAEVEERELAESSLGFMAIDGGAALVHPLPAAESVEELASRLGLAAEVQVVWATARDKRAREWTETVEPAEDELRRRLPDDSLDDAAEVERCRELVLRGRGLRRALLDDLVRALPEDARAAAEPVMTLWEARHRLPEGRTACGRGRGLSGSAKLSDVPWIDWGGNPLEALARTELKPEERAAVERAVGESAAALVVASEAMDDAEAHVAVARVMYRASALWNDQAPIDERLAGWEQAKAEREEILARLEPKVRARAAAASALRATILAALPEGRRDDFMRASFETALPGIDRERPRFERPFLAALGMTGSDAERSTRMVELYAAWDRRWMERTDAIGRVEGGTGYLLAITGGTGPLASARAIHAVALVYWLEVRRRQESIIAMHRLERLLTEEERQRLPRWGVTQ